MFHCERCGIRFSSGALSGRRDCPRCETRDGVKVPLWWQPAMPRTVTGARSADLGRPPVEEPTFPRLRQSA